VSFASEAEIFIDYVVENRATRHFAQGHLEYLADEIDQTAKELEKAHPPANAEPAVQECKQALALLYKEVEAIRAETTNPQALEASKGRIANIRTNLQKSNASL
jgi:hypothetical protein